MILRPIGFGKVGSCLVIYSMADKFKVAIFSSGSGSNFEAIVRADIPNVEVSFLFCNVFDGQLQADCIKRTLQEAELAA